jgi:hypothetical protein
VELHGAQHLHAQNNFLQPIFYMYAVHALYTIKLQHDKHAMGTQNAE